MSYRHASCVLIGLYVLYFFFLPTPPSARNFDWWHCCYPHKRVDRHRATNELRVRLLRRSWRHQGTTLSEHRKQGVIPMVRTTLHCNRIDNMTRNCWEQGAYENPTVTISFPLIIWIAWCSSPLIFVPLYDRPGSIIVTSSATLPCGSPTDYWYLTCSYKM